MKKIKICSLFSGIGGFETGIFNAFGKENCEVVFSSEIDKYASKSYETIYGHTPHGDITKIEAIDIPDHDLLVGGFPCQAFSIAGKRQGFNDKTRGTLFFDIVRIAQEKKPKILFLENVKGLLNHDEGKTIETILLVLSEIGYSVDFNVLNSKNFGVPQNRDRIFIIAIRNGSKEKWEFDKKIDAVKKTKIKLSKIEDIRTFNFHFPEGDTPNLSIYDVLEDVVNEKYFMSEEKTSSLIEEFKKSITSESSDKNIELKMIGRIDIKGNDSIRRVYDPEGLCPTLTTMGGGHREPKIIVSDKQPRIIKIGQLPSDSGQTGAVYSLNGIAPTQLRVHGNAVTKILDVPSYRVRKLTPLECFRLQGLPDDYYHLLKKSGISDSQLYKMAGNAVTTNVISAVAKNLFTYFQ